MGFQKGGDMSETVNNMTVLKVEGLHTLTQIAIQYSQHKGIIKRAHVESVCKSVNSLLDDKKRTVRKFARTCINEWQTALNPAQQ